MTNYPPSGKGQGSNLNSPGESSGKTKFAGLDPNVAAMICYLPICLNFVIATIFFVTERELRFVRFHAAQSLVLLFAWIILNVGLSIAGEVPGVGFFVHWVTLPLVALALFVLYIFLAIRAYNSDWYKLPTLGEFAERLTG